MRLNRTGLEPVPTDIGTPISVLRTGDLPISSAVPSTPCAYAPLETTTPSSPEFRRPSSSKARSTPSRLGPPLMPAFQPSHREPRGTSQPNICNPLFLFSKTSTRVSLRYRLADRGHAPVTGEQSASRQPTRFGEPPLLARRIGPCSVRNDRTSRSPSPPGYSPNGSYPLGRALRHGPP